MWQSSAVKEMRSTKPDLRLLQFRTFAGVVRSLVFCLWARQEPLLCVDVS